MKDKLVRNFVIGTFVSLYLLVSVISTIHVIDFFELSNPYWLAVTLAVGFEVGAAASLASLVILKKMNKTLVWALFITITLMQMQGNMYYAFINLNDFESWSQLFNLIEEDPLYQKRILAFVSGAILPLIALGFIKSLVDYIKPDEDEEVLTDGTLDDNLLTDDFETKPSKEYFEDIEEQVKDMRNVVNAYDNLQDEIETHVESSAHAVDVTISTEMRDKWNMLADQLAMNNEELEEQAVWDQTLLDGLEEEEWDEDHAFDQVLNDMAADLDANMTEEEIQSLINETVPEPFATPEELAEKPWWDGPIAELKMEAEEAPEEPVKKEDMLDILEQEVEESEINETSVGSIVKEKGLIDDEKLWNEAMAKKAKEDMESFIKKKNGNN